MDGKQEIKYYKRYADDILIILDNKKRKDNNEP